MTIVQLEATLLENVPLADLTSLGIGGPARYVVDIDNTVRLTNALTWATKMDLPILVLGDGTNVVVADTGFDGLVVRMNNQSVECDTDETKARVIADAGVSWDTLVECCVNEGWTGIECLSGIPGRVGAAPVQNIGAYGQQLSTTLDAVHAIERATGKSRRIAATDCGLGYRTSVFKQSGRDGWVITKVELRLERESTSVVSHHDLLRILGDRQADVAATRQAVLEVRHNKSMLLDADDRNSKSVGSFFVNPVVSALRANDIARIFADDKMPQQPAGHGHVKLSAAWLIEHCGFTRGESHGRVGLSDHHTLAIVNRDNATATDGIAFAQRIRSRVAEATDIVLEPEPVFVGFDAPVFYE